MYYIFEWHYKELHSGVSYHIVVIGKVDGGAARADLDDAPDDRRREGLQCQPTDGELSAAGGENINSWGQLGAMRRLARDDDSAAHQVVEHGFGQLFWFATRRR
jgi:hypothetical protein